jgi:hypothetical protein
LLVIAWAAVAAATYFACGGRLRFHGCTAPLPGECTFDMLAFYYDDYGTLQCDCLDDINDDDAMIVGEPELDDLSHT